MGLLRRIFSRSELRTSYLDMATGALGSALVVPVRDLTESAPDVYRTVGCASYDAIMAGQALPDSREKVGAYALVWMARHFCDEAADQLLAIGAAAAAESSRGGTTPDAMVSQTERVLAWLRVGRDNLVALRSLLEPEAERSLRYSRGAFPRDLVLAAIDRASETFPTVKPPGIELIRAKRGSRWEHVLGETLKRSRAFVRSGDARSACIAIQATLLQYRLAMRIGFRREVSEEEVRFLRQAEELLARVG